MKLPYQKLVKRLVSSYAPTQAMSLAVGGEFDAVGILERELLIHLGLHPDHYLIDVGCGSGRLARPLSDFLKGRYLGIDIVPELVEHARAITNRRDWRFEVAPGFTIPERDQTADMVCFFSVFTHLLHEQSYVYLQEAKRVLKPTGKIIFSFLDFSLEGHWNVFEGNIRDVGKDNQHLNVFISRDAIHAWSSHLSLNVDVISDYGTGIPLSEPVKFEDGRVMENEGTLGQSVCVLSLS